MSEERDELLEGIQESVRRLAHGSTRAAAQLDDVHEKTRLAVRRLARSRISETLRQLRAANGLTYERVQERSGLSQQLIFDLEYKERRLTLDELRKLCQCYNIGADDILGIDLEAG